MRIITSRAYPQCAHYLFRKQASCDGLDVLISETSVLPQYRTNATRRIGRRQVLRFRSVSSAAEERSTLERDIPSDLFDGRWRDLVYPSYPASVV